MVRRGHAGFNCAEAVNFGPPDWLPWGTYVAKKYRREGRSATLSHDALLIALVTAAPDVQARLQREAKVHIISTWFSPTNLKDQLEGRFAKSEAVYCILSFEVVMASR